MDVGYFVSRRARVPHRCLLNYVVGSKGGWPENRAKIALSFWKTRSKHLRGNPFKHSTTWAPSPSIHSHISSNICSATAICLAANLRSPSSASRLRFRAGPLLPAEARAARHRLIIAARSAVTGGFSALCSCCSKKDGSDSVFGM